MASSIGTTSSIGTVPGNAQGICAGPAGAALHHYRAGRRLPVRHEPGQRRADAAPSRRF